MVSDISYRVVQKYGDTLYSVSQKYGDIQGDPEKW